MYVKNSLIRIKVFLQAFLFISLVVFLFLNDFLKAQEEAKETAASSEPMVQDTEWDGVSVELISVKPTSGNTLTIKFKYTNGGSQEANISRLGKFDHDNVVEHVYYVDTKNNKKYLVVKDSEGNPLGTNLKYFTLAAGQSKSCWAKFPAPPSDVTKISVYLPGAPPFEDFPVSQ